MFEDPFLSQLQALKGGVEVFVTAGLILILARGRESQMQRGMEKLDQQRTELQVLHRVLRHNLRNDLNVIQGYAEIIKSEVDSEGLLEDCEMILEAVEKLSQYTDQAGRINKITESNGYRQSFDLTEMVPRLVERHSDSVENPQISTDLPAEATVEGNRMLESALSELIRNALAHNDKEYPRVSITVDPDSGPAHLAEIRVADNGPGIPEMEREPLLAEQEDKLLHLSGLGLWFVKWTVRHSQGEMEIVDEQPDGATVILRIPMTSQMFLSHI